MVRTYGSTLYLKLKIQKPRNIQYVHIDLVESYCLLCVTHKHKHIQPQKVPKHKHIQPQKVLNQGFISYAHHSKQALIKTSYNII